jgi:predicted nuclease of predicted toxin-antitoxin system
MIWLDAHLSPRVATWLQEDRGQEARALRELGLRDSEDEEIFLRARDANVVLLTKDKDFSDLVTRLGPPPSVIWLRCGNTSEHRLKEILRLHLAKALSLIERGEPLVEIQ